MVNNDTIKFFEEICKIPHETFNETKLADYIEDFVKYYNFYYTRDKYNNFYIRKQINKNSPYTIFQAHLDMVCIKDNDYNIDFKKEGIKLIKTKSYLKAYKTSLGADNGIGVAMILSLLKNANFNIEVVFTTDEEVSSTGAENFDYSQLLGRDIISLDGFRSNEIILGCASICDMKISIKPKFTKLNETKKGYKLLVDGLPGGHSGADIDKKIGNAIKISSSILDSCFDNIEIGSFVSGNQFNFIPNSAEICFFADKKNNFENIIQNIKKENVNINISLLEEDINETLNLIDSKNILLFLKEINTGVLKKDDNKRIVLSQNLACINLIDGIIKISQRGFDENLDNSNIVFLENLSKKYDYKFNIFDRKSGYKTDDNCKLINDLCSINKLVNKTNLIKKIENVSLEGCVFKEHIKELNIAIVSPDVFNPHSTQEKVFIPSIKKCYNLIVEYLRSHA